MVEVRAALEAILFAIRDMPQRIRDGWTDPVRRRYLLWRIVEEWAGGAAVGVGVLWRLDRLADSWWQAPAWALLTPVVTFVVYEFLLEPLGAAGHYYERGPRVGEVFTFPGGEDPSRYARLADFHDYMRLWEIKAADRDAKLLGFVETLRREMVFDPAADRAAMLDALRQARDAAESMRREVLEQGRTQQVVTGAVTETMQVMTDTARALHGDMSAMSTGLTQTLAAEVDRSIGQTRELRSAVNNLGDALRGTLGEYRIILGNLDAGLRELRAENNAFRDRIVSTLAEFRIILASLAPSSVKGA